tara:strand:- start:1689 stop:1868 length:180 start_codon:yes stop_codon:yes gene_type:complete
MDPQKQKQKCEAKAAALAADKAKKKKGLDNTAKRKSEKEWLAYLMGGDFRLQGAIAVKP